MNNDQLGLRRLIDYDFPSFFNPSITDEQYHADKNHISSSSIRKVIHSPKAWYYDFVLGKKDAPTAAMKLGTLIHSAVLSGRNFMENHTIMPDFTAPTRAGNVSAKSKGAKEAKEAWLLEQPKDKLIVTPDEADIILGIIESLHSHTDAMALLSDGKPEVAGYCSDPATGIKLKIKPDFLSNDFNVLVDLKTTTNVDARLFGRTAFDLRYDVQMYYYAKCVELITGTMPKMIAIIAAEKSPPYECAVYYFETDDLFYAKIDVDNALVTLKDCIESGSFMQKQVSMDRIITPQWYINERANNL